ncbi:hypothetical protein K8I61_09500, partial [bacterium]|nr:hypothetical protein [bacterium]
VVALIAVLSLFMCTRASAVFWEYVPLLPFVQFPYRFLMLATVACAALAGAPSALAREKLGVAGAAGAAIVVVSAAFLLHGAKVQARYIFHDRADPGRIVKVDKAAASLLRLAPHVVGADELLTRETLREARETRATARDDYLPIGVSRKPDRYEPNLVEVIDGQAEANPFAVRGTHFEIDIRADTPARVLVHKFYFPGWTARDDGRVLTSLGPHDPTGEIVFSVPAGRHRVTVSFEDTRTRLWAKLASLAAASAAVLWIGLTQFSARRRGRRSYDRAGAD